MKKRKRERDQFRESRSSSAREENFPGKIGGNALDAMTRKPTRVLFSFQLIEPRSEVKRDAISLTLEKEGRRAGEKGIPEGE